MVAKQLHRCGIVIVIASLLMLFVWSGCQYDDAHSGAEVITQSEAIRIANQLVGQVIDLPSGSANHEARSEYDVSFRPAARSGTGRQVNHLPYGAASLTDLHHSIIHSLDRHTDRAVSMPMAHTMHKTVTSRRIGILVIAMTALVITAISYPIMPSRKRFEVAFLSNYSSFVVHQVRETSRVSAAEAIHAISSINAMPHISVSGVISDQKPVGAFACVIIDEHLGEVMIIGDYDESIAYVVNEKAEVREMSTAVARATKVSETAVQIWLRRE